jgi:hypothetical protein
MAHAFTLTGPGAAAEQQAPASNSSSDPSGAERRRVLVTGAAGRIGSYFARNANNKYDLRLMVARPTRPKAWTRSGPLARSWSANWAI